MNQDPVNLKEYLLAIIEENDKRYEQRFRDTKIAVDAALIAADKAVAAALAGQKEAVIKAENASEKRFESVNEFRNTLSDQQRTFLPRNEYIIAHTSLGEKVDNLNSRLDKSEGKGTGFSSSWGILLGAVGLISVIYSLISNVN